MVVKRGLLLAVASALTVVVAAAAPMAAATKEAKPTPLRAASKVRVKDIAATGAIKPGVVAIGYHDVSADSQLYVAWSVDGGRDYRKSNGQLRRYRVVGEPALGVTTDVCAGRVWVGSGWHHPNDRAGDSDVILTSRTIKGGAAQALMTKTSRDHRVRDVTVTCASSGLLAVGWLQKSGSVTTAKLMLRTVEALGTTPAYKKTFDLGPAEFKSGIDVVSTSDQVAVAFVRNGDLRLHRLALSGNRPGLASQKTIALDGVKFPKLGAKKNRLAVAYSDAGKVKAKLSADKGARWTKHVLSPVGGTKHPSRPYSIAVAGKRVVSTAGIYSASAGRLTPKRISSPDFGGKWATVSFGNIGARLAALLPVAGKPARLVEGWHNNAPKGTADTLRARYEL